MPIEASVTIDRRVEDVFAFVSDATNDPQWSPDVIEAIQTGTGPIGLGTTFHARFKPFIIGPAEGNIRLSGYERSRRLELDIAARYATLGSWRFAVTYRFKPVNGKTMVTRQVELRPPGFLRLVLPLMGGLFTKRNTRFVSNLKYILERAR